MFTVRGKYNEQYGNCYNIVMLEIQWQKNKNHQIVEGDLSRMASKRMCFDGQWLNKRM